MPRPNGLHVPPELEALRERLEAVIDAGGTLDHLANELEPYFSAHPNLPKTLTRKQLVRRVLEAMALETRRMRERRLLVARYEREQKRSALAQGCQEEWERPGEIPLRDILGEHYE